MIATFPVIADEGFHRVSEMEKQDNSSDSESSDTTDVDEVWYHINMQHLIVIKTVTPLSCCTDRQER